MLSFSTWVYDSFFGTQVLVRYKKTITCMLIAGNLTHFDGTYSLTNMKYLIISLHQTTIYSVKKPSEARKLTIFTYISESKFLHQKFL